MKKLSIGLIALLLFAGESFAATSRIQVTEGAGKNVATNSFAEDAVTKEAQRVVPNNSSGTEIGTLADPLRVDPTGTTTQPISAASLPLPTGAATAALQTTGNTSLATIAGAVSGTEMQVDVLTMPSTTVTATNLDIRDLVFATDKVDASGTTLGANSGVDIGDVTINNGAAGAAVNIQDGGNTITVDGTVISTATDLDIRDLLFATDKVDASGTILGAGDNNIGNVDVLTIAAGDNNIGNVDIVSGTITTVSTVTSVSSVATNPDVEQATASALNAEVQGDAANASPVSGNPVLVGMRASNAVPTDVGADGDAVSMWATRNGAPIVAELPHLGMVGAAPYTLTTHTVQYTTTQTGTAVITPTGGNRIVVTRVQIQVGGTTAGTAQLWFEAANGDTTYTRGTDDAIFDGEFAPSATSKPGVVMQGPFIGQAADFDLRFTDSAAINPITLTIWYYEITG